MVSRVPPHAYFVGSALFHYLGPAFAVLLFARIDVSGVAWLRIVSAAAIFAVWRRPWVALVRGDRETRLTVVALGVVLAMMNLSFYGAIDRLPLGTVAAIEFLGPIGLAVVGARTAHNVAALGFAAAGVYLLTDVRLAGEPLGIALAFVNGALFTLYIVLAHRSARLPGPSTPIQRLGAAMVVAAVVVTPIGLGGAAPALVDPVALFAGIGVGITSSVIPYVFDQVAMAQLPRSTYALFVALLPATAVVIGILVLHQIPALVGVAGVACVIVGVAVHQDVSVERQVTA